MRQRAHSFLYSATRLLAGSGLPRLLPAGVRRALRLLMDVPVIAALSEDRRSFRRLARVWVQGPSQPPATLRIKGMGDPVVVRPGTADLAVARDLVISKPHLAGEDRDGSKGLIWDLGAHIGLAARQYAARNAGARVTAVEFDPENARLCRSNLACFGDRCQVVQAAVWSVDGQVAVHGASAGDTNAHRVAGVDDAREHGDSMASALSLNTLAGRCEDATVDFCKMDIEGAERSVLRENTEWASKVTTISVEVHGSYSERDCAQDLRRLGFEPVSGAGGSQVIATRTRSSAR